MRDAAAASAPPATPRSRSAIAAVALAVFAPALQGNFVSDDIGYVVGNPWIHTLSAENVRAILDPTGPAAAHTANYAPVHLLLHALFWQLFGANTLGHHVVNVLLHAVTSVLLVALFVRARVPFVAAALGGACFLLHPANVEAVAWVFQLKTIVRWRWRRPRCCSSRAGPLLATLLFALALLAKIQAAFAIPVLGVAIAIAPSRRRPARGRARARAALLGVWVVAARARAAARDARLRTTRPRRVRGARSRSTSAPAPSRASSAATSRWRRLRTARPRSTSPTCQPRGPIPGVCSAHGHGRDGGARAVDAAPSRRRGAVLGVGRGRLRPGLAGAAVPVPDGRPLPLLHPAGPDRRGTRRGTRAAGATRGSPAQRRRRARRCSRRWRCSPSSVGARPSARRSGAPRSTLARDAAAHYPNGIPAQLLRAQNAARTRRRRRRRWKRCAPRARAARTASSISNANRSTKALRSRRALPRRRSRSRGRLDRPRRRIAAI